MIGKESIRDQKFSFFEHLIPENPFLMNPERRELDMSLFVAEMMTC